MTISILNPVGETWMFASIFFIFLVVSIKEKRGDIAFKSSVTRELKGLSILAIIFAHIGYFLINDHRFLFPLSIISGVAVDMFLFLSGYGIASSASDNQKYNITNFYKKRLPKLFIPFWIVLFLFLILDFFVLKINYSWQFIAQSVFGFFPHADIYNDLNSPMWYFTLIAFYYLIFPIFFSKKKPYISAILIYILTYVLVYFVKLPIFNSVTDMYKAHIIAFPLGILFAWIFDNGENIKNFFLRKYKEFYKEKKESLFVKDFDKLISSSKFQKFIRYLAITILLVIAGYTSYYSGVGFIEKVRIISIITMLSIWIIFLLKRFEFKLFSLFGKYSYEIYLLHWPILIRYDIFYKYMPASVTTVLYLGLFLIFAIALRKITNLILKKKN